MVAKIETPQQYLVTRATRDDFLNALEKAQAATTMHPIQQGAYIEAYQSEIDRLNEAIADYEQRGDHLF